MSSSTGGAPRGASSTLKIENGTVIQHNTLDGVRLQDTSVIGSQNAAGVQITGNSRYGILCDPSPAVAQITPHFSGVGFSINGSHVSGNMGGQISCPGIVIP